MVSHPYRSKSQLSNISAQRFPGTRKYKKISPDDMNIQYTCEKQKNFELGTMVTLHDINNEVEVNGQPGVVIGFRMNDLRMKYYHVLLQNGKVLEMVSQNMDKKDRWDCVEHYDSFRPELACKLAKAPAKLNARIAAAVARFDHRYKPSIIFDILSPEYMVGLLSCVLTFFSDGFQGACAFMLREIRDGSFIGDL